ncbi:long chain acyl-CoA synthetase 4 [Coccomyxa subellipsoidea C-169]|uniref:Long-chain-fatty-acid--CoA ligase n=1 Tax=Coccomyxa subellipsoidea (strain C-169) TaxID=574566 RepID=I0YJY0_COCSC|nr:long chain acyl-CoA synthetase 4 [Coccomyxa subellipsoidea C-169]EIE18699.1 long chain acyl-CoA synthetase 4 [Coccomyxa subellipsoidea C-169]|eukprot:XP_005643243.1 long chain acyl-CoA synthetase 4 [Coccomyxa subellipsoidea C-169]
MATFKDNPYIYEVSGPQRETKRHPARGTEYGNVDARNGWPTVEGASSLYEMFYNSVAKYPDNPCLGHRPIKYGVPQEYQWMTYKETADKVDAVASGIMALGLKQHGRVGVYGINSPEWMMAMQACNRQSAYCVPLYDTLGSDAVRYIINHAEVTVVFADSLKMPALIQPLAETKGQVSAVVYWGECDTLAKVSIEESGLTKCYSWSELLEMGRKSPSPAIPPKPEDLCTIMYTSGTTGNPKGVMLTHANLLSVVAGQLGAINQVGGRYGQRFTQEDVMISYLPLAHIFDRALEEMFLANGARIGYWRGSIEGVIDDLQALRPTLFIGVPRVFDKVYDGVFARLKDATCLRRAIFHAAFWHKQRHINLGYRWTERPINLGYRWTEASPLADALVFDKVRAKLGGRVRLVCSGGAPLARHVEEFLKTAMCAPCCQGYGLTETCGSSFIALPEPMFNGTVGGPLPLLTFRLEAVPEMGYDPLADPPRGEIIIKGPVVFQGYYKDQEKTDEVLDKDGWFHTGDIGELTPIGSLKIIDRKKDLFKLSQGEYIAPERIEGALKKASAVQQVYIHGNSFESSLVAVVVPTEAELRSAVAGAPEDYEKLCASQAAQDVVQAQMHAVGKAAGLKSFELPKAVHLTTEVWSPENGLLTPTFKLKRAVVRRAFQAQIDTAYARLAKSAK